MARKKNTDASTEAKAHLAARLRAVRVDRFGDRGGSELAHLLGLPTRTWYNYEIGVTVPAEVLLRFLEVTGAEPRWLLHGAGPTYRESESPEIGAMSIESSAPGIETATIEGLLDSVVRRLRRGGVRITWEPDPTRGTGAAPDR